MLRNTKLILIGLLVVAFFLRVWQINKVPIALFGDEVDVGYQAYSILKTGKDYYGNFMPIHFHSLAEWRTPLYLYSAVPTVALFGITAMGVRLPAVIFGVLSIWALYLLVKELTKNEKLALISAIVLTFSPWHIQYSRAGFEVTELLFFLLMGLYLFFVSFRNSKYLWISMVCFALTPWVYSTAKLFTPILMLFLFFVWRKDVLNISKRHLVFALVALVIVGGPIAVSTVVGGGAQRFGYISVFSDPTIEPEVGTARGIDAKARGETGTGLNPTIIDKMFHNKFTFVGGKIANNYLQPFSSEFLFNSGDPNPRHSIDGMGEFYKIEAVTLLLGLIFFFTAKTFNTKTKALILFWILAGVIPAAITRDGGNHATRLILILPPLVFLVAYGFMRLPKFASIFYILLFVMSFVFYQHNYWNHNPYQSERWWHAGYQEAIQSVKAIDMNYDNVVISTAAEPPWIFFAGFYNYDPASWQKNFPIGNDIVLAGFGKVSHIDKFYFGSPEVGGVYNFAKAVDKKTLYLASAKEVNVNLIMNPETLPKDLVLLKAIAYPSGEPAFYLFSGK